MIPWLVGPLAEQQTRPALCLGNIGMTHQRLTAALWPQPAHPALPHELLSETPAPADMSVLAAWLAPPALPLLELLPELCWRPPGFGAVAVHMHRPAVRLCSWHDVAWIGCVG